ncbi:tail fiber assembly protein [Kluyvera intermedia]|uniref:Tail fiber assembly protein n=1 Tax=Kluyvera intermedia TaxID=61648 RepID=A0AA95FZ45_KLUIN|nr:tail fiber assembly protein [Kluyvera intermedia]WGL54433.1 tail fiber assembly protein [Kluyvera intermedia]
MNEYYFSPSTNAFYPSLMFDDYNAAKTLPDDLNSVSKEVFIEFSGLPPQGKIRAPGSDGMPSWQDVPPPTHEEEVATADAQKQLLIDQANAYISSKQWPGKAAMGRLSDTEKEQYNAWLDNLDALEEVDTSSAPDIEWPTPPEVPAR